MSGNAQDVAAFILAGGQSTRMGTDKAFVQLDGQTLLARALDLGRSIAADVRIAGSVEKFARFAPVVEDVFRDRGPLGGIHAALLSSSCEFNLMLAVDTPFIPAALLLFLLQRARGSGAVVTVPRLGNLWQPLCAIYRREFVTVAEDALRVGRYKIDALFEIVPTLAIRDKELAAAGFSADVFRNLNTVAELEAAKREA